MRYYETSTVFQYSWTQVAQALWKRYPNPESSHVLSEDTVSRKIVEGKLYTKRLLTKTNRLPKWGERFVSSKNVPIIEESIIDPSKREICTYTRNVGSTKILSCVEKVVYRPCPTNSLWTVAEKKAWFDSTIFGVGYAIKSFGLERYRKNAIRANRGFMHVMKTLFPSTVIVPEAIPELRKVEENRLRLKDAAKETAKRAKEIAQERTRPIFASCES